MNKFEYKNLTPFKWFVLENFPFIEADFDALTEWQLFCKLGKEMNKIITSENTLGTQVESVTNAFIELQNYVNNYFENLDIQEEVNEKLNQMAQSGELSEIIAQYLELQGLLCYNTINDLKNADNIANGSFIRTFGTVNYMDGIGNYYKIREILNTDIIDNNNIVALNNYPNLVAVKILNYKTNIVCYNNIQELKSDNNIKDNNYILLLGRENYLDCKPILLKTEILENTPNEIDSIELSNNLVAKFIVNENDSVYLSQYNNLDYILRNFKNVVIDKNYTLNNSIVITSDYKIELLEGLSNIIQCLNNGLDIKKDFIKIRNINLEGSYNLSTIGINLNSSYNYFDNISVNHFGIGINIVDSGCWNNNFIRCNINQNTKFGVFISSSADKQHNDFHFNMCRFVGNGQNVLDDTEAQITQGDAIKILGGINISITNCDIETNSNAGIWLSDNDYQLRNITVENCYIENNKLTSIYLYKGTGAQKNINLNNNFFNPTNRNIPNKLNEQEVAYVLRRGDEINIFSLPSKNINLKYNENTLREMCKSGVENIFPVSNFKYLKNIENIGYTINEDGSITLSDFVFWGYNIPILKGITYKMQIYGEALEFVSGDTITVKIVIDNSIFEHTYTLTQEIFRLEANSINTNNLEGIARLEIATSNKLINIKSLLIKPNF